MPAVKSSPQDVDRVIRLYRDQHLSIRAVAAMTGRAYGTVHRWLVINEIPRRPSGGRRRRTPPIG